MHGNRDLALMALAARQGGVVTTGDLRTCGFSEPAMRFAMRRGLVKRWGRGVYLVGPLTTPFTEARAAARAVRHGVMGFGVAAQVAEIGPIAPPPVDVIVQEAFAKRLTSVRELERALERHRGGRGTARLERMLELGVDDLRSKAEQSLRRWVRAACLPGPAFNARVGPWTVDALWPEHGLAVEVNGYAAHSSPWAHDRDHRKEQHLRTAGLDVRRFTALQAIDEPALVIAQVAAALAAQKR